MNKINSVSLLTVAGWHVAAMKQQRKGKLETHDALSKKSNTDEIFARKQLKKKLSNNSR